MLESGEQIENDDGGPLIDYCMVSLSAFRAIHIVRENSYRYGSNWRAEISACKSFIRLLPNFVTNLCEYIIHQHFIDVNSTIYRVF